MNDFGPIQYQSSSPDSGIANSEQSTPPSRFTDITETNELSVEMQRIFNKCLENLSENVVLNSDIKRMEERVIEVFEYPGNVNLFGFSKKLLDKGDLKRIHRLESNDFKRNGPESEVLKISIKSLTNTASSSEYVARIMDGYELHSENADKKIRYAMQNVEGRKHLDNISFFDQSRVYRDKANRLAYLSMENIIFSFEDSEERKMCAVDIKKALGGIYVSIIDFRNPDKAKMFVTETPILLEDYTEEKFNLLKQKISNHLNKIRKESIQ